MPTVTCPIPDQESSQERSAWNARSYEGMEHPAKPTAARRSWARWSSTPRCYTSASAWTSTGARASTRYSITWSARSSSVCGIVSPSAFAVFVLMTNSNLIGCSIGRSEGFAPLRILSTNDAALRK